jgi:hypothetical protein
VTETNLPNWLIAFDIPVEAEAFKTRKEWLEKLNAIHIAETHDQNPVALGPLKEWHSTPSTPVGGKHGTAMLTATAPESVKAETNVAGDKGHH